MTIDPALKPIREMLPGTSHRLFAARRPTSRTGRRRGPGWSTAGRSLVCRSTVAVGVDFRPAAGLVASLRQLVAVESECCPWMDLRLREEQGIQLRATGPADAAGELRRIFGVSA